MKKNVLMTAVILLGIMSGCTDSLEQQLTPAAEVETELATRASSGRLSTYTPPSYIDDYASMAGWDQRGSWNLANVHDPTVMKADDGYYYMYQTDASYGNSLDGHGHFFCRKSKDLINWTWVGPTMRRQPSWVATKVNEYRAKEGLPAIKHFRYGFWAPCARKVRNGLYRMYYCIVVDNYIGNGLYADAANLDRKSVV